MFPGARNTLYTHSREEKRKASSQRDECMGVGGNSWQETNDVSRFPIVPPECIFNNNRQHIPAIPFLILLCIAQHQLFSLFLTWLLSKEEDQHKSKYLIYLLSDPARIFLSLWCPFFFLFLKSFRWEMAALYRVQVASLCRLGVYTQSLFFKRIFFSEANDICNKVKCLQGL